MNSLKCFCIALLAAVVVGSVPPPAPIKVPADKCFTQTRECCFKFKQCGKETKVIKKNVPCPYRMCTKVCKPQCTAASSLRLEEKCVTDKYGKKVCTKVPVQSTSKTCTNVCKDECKTVQGTCVQTQTLMFFKFCADLSCGHFKGDMPKPPAIMADKGMVTKSEMGKPKMS